MSFIEWTTKNEIHVPIVDEQHKKLFAILNKLHEAVSLGKEQSALATVLDELIEYTVYHFDTEEQLFAEYAFPGAPEHKAEHDKLTGQAVELQQRMQEGETAISFEVLDFLYDWLMDHTIGLDSEFGAFLVARGDVELPGIQP